MIEGLKEGPFEHTKTFSAKCIFLRIIKMHLILIQDFYHINMHVIEKTEFWTAKSLNCIVSAKFFFPRMLVKTPYFGGVINPKTS